MKRFLFFLLVSLLPVLALAGGPYYPEVAFENLTPDRKTVYYGQQQMILIKMTHKNLKFGQEWRLPQGVQLFVNHGICPSFANGEIYFPFGGDCYFSLIIPGDKVGHLFNGKTMYRLSGFEYPLVPWDLAYDVPISVLVIPRPLSMANIPILNATANVPFVADLKNYVSYYAENLEVGTVHGVVTPTVQDGLYFDQALFSIVGTPKRTGVYLFSVAAENGGGRTAPTNLIIHVGINTADKPKFQTNRIIPSATPGQAYQLNLKELVESPLRYLNNPLRFRIDTNETHPDWLRIGGDGNFLMGEVPMSEAGSEKEVTLIASSNTGGDSSPLKIYIPISTDPKSKPSIAAFSLEKRVGNEFSFDVRKFVNDPSSDANLKLVIDKIEPEAPWLHVSAIEPTLLTGVVPAEVTGQEYQITLHVNTRGGGDSDKIQVPLNIAIDEEQKPRFKAANPQLPIAYPGQPFYHDFILNLDVFPEYEQTPYVIEWAKNYDKPSWLRIEDNKLIADEVPKIHEQEVQIYLTIKNTPGGRSGIIPLSLLVMN
ncbi:hypothetical protein Lnau_2306 [Legionella nautarum]|uniref:Uncharacterized protein n=1 Tax=Legionella nautarum TaxID=45070 RepID=A0A0W0WMS2_9GAMM|nr:hypothetical protein [Legionella nautarum]KTD33555.1 hypothetical protein Lnau_2306 [Legionella nautarum]